MIKKKGAKLLMVILMISGFIFSAVNYISIELKGGVPPVGGSLKGEWTYNQFGGKECDGKGTECDIGGSIE
jgi:hypothetical protein